MKKIMSLQRMIFVSLLVFSLLPNPGWGTVLLLNRPAHFSDTISGYAFQNRMLSFTRGESHLHAPQSTAELLKRFFSGTERLLIKSGNPAPSNVRQQTIFQDLDIVVLETNSNEAMNYVGNHIEALRQSGNRVHILTTNDMDVEAALRGMSKIDFFILPENDPQLDSLIRVWGKSQSKESIGVLRFQTFERLYAEPAETINPIRPNFFIGADDAVLEQVVESLKAHRSQLERTDYVTTVRSYAKATAHLARSLGLPIAEPNAQKFYVCDLSDIQKENNRWEIHQKKRRDYTRDELFTEGVTVVKSPHPDDRVIAAGFLSIQNLQHPNTMEIELIHGSGHAGLATTFLHQSVATLFMVIKLPLILYRIMSLLSIGDPLLWKDVIRYQWRYQMRLAKTLFQQRTHEAEKSARLLAPGVSSERNVVKHLKLDLLNNSYALRDFNREVLVLYFEYLEAIRKHVAHYPGQPFKVVLAHPEDAHWSHTNSTQADYAALKMIEREYPNVEIKLIHYMAPWYGRLNTYFQSTENVAVNYVFTALQELHQAVAFNKMGLATLISELTTLFGGRSHPVDQMGGQYAEAFFREFIYMDESVQQPEVRAYQGARFSFAELLQKLSEVMMDRVSLPIERWVSSVVFFLTEKASDVEMSIRLCIEAA